mgnify:CR=1 FL=1
MGSLGILGNIAGENHSLPQIALHPSQDDAEHSRVRTDPKNLSIIHS